MGPKNRKACSSSQRIDIEADHFGDDVRLARRWKRRCIANQNFKRNSDGRKKIDKCGKVTEENPNCTYIQIDNDEEEVDAHEKTLYDEVNADGMEFVDRGGFADGPIVSGDDVDEAGSANNGHVDANVVNWCREPFIHCNGAVNDGSMNDRFVDDDIVCVSPGNGTVSANTDVIVGAKSGDRTAFPVDGFREEDIVCAGIMNNANTDVRFVDGDDGNIAANDASVVVDPYCKPFLVNLRRNRDSKFSVGKVPPVTNKCQSEDMPFVECHIESAEAMSDCSNRDLQMTEGVLRSCLRREKMENCSDLRMEKPRAQVNLRNVPCRELKSPWVERKMKMKTVEPISCKASCCPSKRPKQKDLNLTSPKDQCDVEPNMLDESYLTFLISLKKDGNYVVLMTENSERMMYEEEEQSSSESEIMVLDGDPSLCGNSTPVVTSEMHEYFDQAGEGFIENSGRNGSSPFRERLIEILKKPFDEKEYHQFMEEASRRRLVERDRDLRGGIKTYKTLTIGKSYLEQHSGLAEKIKSAQPDRLKILNLLRGFFFWLENLACEGMFYPWLDRSCLEVLPQLN